MRRESSENEGSGIRIVNGYIDLASLLNGLPEDLHAEAGDEYIVLAKTSYAGRVKRCEIRIRRYVDERLFPEFLGLYVSDGSKKFDRVRFSNTNVQYHKKVADALKHLGAHELVAYVYHSIQDSRELKEAITRFKALTGAEVHGAYFDARAKNPLFELDVCNKSLAMFLLVAERMFRKAAIAGRLPRKLVARYLRGVMEGDGSIRIRIGRVKKGEEEKAEGVYISISEKNEEIAKDFIKIFYRYYGVKLHSYGYDHVATLNLQHLLELLHDEVFPEEYADKIRRRLLIALKRKGVPWILLQLVKAFGDKAFTVFEASKVLGKSRNHARDSLINLENMGYVKSWKEKISEKRKGTPVRRFFKLTRKALETAKILSSLLFPSFYSFYLGGRIHHTLGSGNNSWS